MKLCVMAELLIAFQLRVMENLMIKNYSQS